MHGHFDACNGVEPIVLSVTRAELYLIAGGINESLEAVEDWEFSTRLGVDKAAARQLASELGHLIGRLLTDDGTGVDS